MSSLKMHGVPYTGANRDVNLGDNSITANQVFIVGASAFVRGNASSDTSGGVFTSYRNSAVTHTIVEGRAGRGTADTPLHVQSGDSLLRISAAGWNGSTFVTPGGDVAAQINFVAASEFNGTLAGSGRINFDVLGVGDNFRTTRMFVTSAGVDVVGVLTLQNTGLHILDTDASHDLIIAPGSNLTADRTLTITTGDANRTLTLSGDATISGTNTGDQTLPTRDSLGLDTDDTVTFANLSGTNTGDQDLSGYQLTSGLGTFAFVTPTETPTGSKFLRDDNSWQTIPGGGDALTSNPLSQFAATTSSQLLGVISDETGSGSLVFATSPTLVTPALGTPSSGTLTNCTGLPNSGTTATATNTASAIVARDGSGDFAAGTITAALTGTASGNLALAGGLMTGAVRHTNTVNTPSGTSQTIDWTLGNVQTLTLSSATGAVTLTFTPPASAMAQLSLKIVQGGTARDINWPGSVKWDDEGEPDWGTDTSKTRIVSFLYDGTNYFGLPSETFS